VNGVVAGNTAGYGQGIGVVAPLTTPYNSQADSGGAQSSVHLPPPAAAGKPVSSVAPVFATPSSAALASSNNAMSINNRYGTPQQQAAGNLSMMTPPRLSSTPLSTAAGYMQQPGSNDFLQRQNQASPTKLRPALPPKPVMPGGGGNNSSAQQQGQPPVHGEEGTSVDDVEDLPPPPPTTEPPSDSPTPEVDYLNGNAMASNSKDLSVSVPVMGLENPGGLMVTSATGGAGETGVHVSINRFHNFSLRFSVN
jgi:hypothetical protein